MKLSLGTVQLGVHYGVNNTKGMLTDAEANTLLATARRAGFTMLDTSSEYGLAEERIGKYLQAHPDAFEVNGKYNAAYPREKILALIEQSRKRMGRVDHIMYYCIGVDIAKLNPEGADGVSVYDVAEAETVHSLPYKNIQVPASILDGRMDAELRVLRSLGKRTFVRSLLLQGLLSEPYSGVLRGNVGNGAFVEAAKPYLAGLREIADENDMSVVEMAVRWAWHLDPDVAIFGAETPQQVNNIGVYWQKGPLHKYVVDQVMNLRLGIPDIVISPRLWGQVYDFTPSKA